MLEHRHHQGTHTSSQSVAPPPPPFFLFSFSFNYVCILCAALIDYVFLHVVSDIAAQQGGSFVVAAASIMQVPLDNRFKRNPPPGESECDLKHSKRYFILLASHIHPSHLFPRYSSPRVSCMYFHSTCPSISSLPSLLLPSPRLSRMCSHSPLSIHLISPLVSLACTSTFPIHPSLSLAYFMQYIFLTDG